MKAVREGRTIRITGLPATVEGLSIPSELSIYVNYTDEGDAGALRKAIALDELIIPKIVKALGGRI